MLRGGDVKQIYEMRGAGHSTRAIARELGLARNTVLRYLKSPEAIRPKPRSRRGSKLDPYTEHIDRRLGDGLENCVVLLRELRDLGYDGSNTILSEYVRPRRRRRQPEATMRFETEPGEPPPSECSCRRSPAVLARRSGSCPKRRYPPQRDGPHSGPPRWRRAAGP